MAKYTRFKLIINNKTDIKKLKFDLEYWVNVSMKKYGRPGVSLEKKSGGKDLIFKSDGKTKTYVLPDNATKARYIIRTTTKDKDGDNIVATVNAEVFKKMNSNNTNGTQFELKTTPAQAKKSPNTIKEVLLDTTEVAWYLVKRQESVKDFLKRIYIYTPTSKEENIFRANNPHLFTPVMSLQPGDVVVLSNTSNSNNSDLQKMKKYAKLAKDKLEKLKKQKGFHPELFVYLSDMTSSALSDADFVGISSKPIPTEVTASNKKSDKSMADYLVDGSSAAITFSSQTNKDALKEFGTLIKNYEKAQGTKAGNAKHFSQFRRDNASTYRALNNKLSLSFLQWDQGVRTDKLSKSIKSEMKRAKSFNGGLEAYVNNMEKNGKVTTSLRYGGNLVVAYNAGKGGKEIYNAYDSGDADRLHKAVAIEPLKLSGAVIGAEYGAAKGAVVGAIIVGVTVGTGGIGGVVIVGLSAVVGGFGGGLIGGTIGELIGNGIYEKTKS